MGAREAVLGNDEGRQDDAAQGGLALSHSKPIQCYRCGQDIYFDEGHVSDSGKKIPIDSETDEPHHCPKRQQFKGQKQSFKQDQDAAWKLSQTAILKRLDDIEERLMKLEGQTTL
jgi:hypothetical protein